jgi:hypothetical protein
VTIPPPFIRRALDLANLARRKSLFPVGPRQTGKGALPAIRFSDSPREDLRAYVGAYLKEEIAAEALTRGVPAFSRFLEVAALSHGTVLDLTTVTSPWASATCADCLPTLDSCAVSQAR